MFRWLGCYISIRRCICRTSNFLGYVILNSYDNCFIWNEGRRSSEMENPLSDIRLERSDSDLQALGLTCSGRGPLLNSVYMDQHIVTESVLELSSELETFCMDGQVSLHLLYWIIGNSQPKLFLRSGWVQLKSVPCVRWVEQRRGAVFCYQPRIGLWDLGTQGRSRHTRDSNTGRILPSLRDKCRRIGT